MDADGLTLMALALPFFGAMVAPMVISRLGASAGALVLALVPAVVMARFAVFLPDIARGAALSGGYDWVPSLDVRFSFLIDGLSLTFLLLISGIGTLIVLYACAYLKDHAGLGRFLSFILLFMGAMLGLVASDSFLMLFVFWELTSITSFLLIGFDHAREPARRAALQALVITGGGGLFLLAGLLLAWNITGVTQFSLLAGVAPELQASPFYLAALLMILAGAFTKSAQFPFHAWLANAMEAPTPVSAFLHSATMVKAGVYLLMRLNPSFGGTPEWQILLPLIGGATLLIGALLSIAATDLKRMLAYSTMASLGLMILLTGLGTPHAIEAAAVYLVAHALFKGALFMVAGIIDHETGLRDATRLSGLVRVMPVTFACGAMAALSMAGVAPFAGFLGKEEVYEALAGGDPRSMVFAGLAMLANALMFATAFAVGVRPFVGRATATPKDAHEAPALLWIGPMILALGGLIAALFSPMLHAFVSTPMASAIAGEPRVVTISAMPHPGVPLVMSIVTIGAGIVMFAVIGRLRAAIAAALAAIGWGPDRGFDQALSGLLRLSVAVTRRLQNGRLDTYMTLTFGVVATALIAAPIAFGEMPSLPAWPDDVPFYEVAILAIAVVGLAAVLGAPDRLTAIVALGIQGFAVALIFLIYGAPDLAFTQFMIETLSVVILALVMTRLKLSSFEARPMREVIPDAAIAVTCGIGLTLVVLKATQGPFDTRLSDFFALYSNTVAHGANIVNVIIVDFRATDTLGEIAVVMMTGLAILAMIRLRPGSTGRLADNDPDAEERA